MSLSRVLVSPNRRQYSSDSFDRFGDDLCEFILSYLPLKDKFRFECVSKQWRRLIFNKVLHFDDFSLFSPTDEELDVKFKNLKTILEKCPNIKTIKLYVTEQTVPLLSLLSDNCPRLKSIELLVIEEVSFQSMSTFCQTLGSKVEAINTLLMSHNIEMLNWFPNLKRFKFQEFDDWLSLVGNQLVPELNHLGRVSINSDQISVFAQLVDKYKNTMKNVFIHFHEDINIDLIFQQLYRLNNLECLNIFHGRSLGVEFDLTPKLIAMSENCSKLSKIDLHLDQVSLTLPSKPMTSLKCLSLRCRKIRDNFFANLSLLTPNLKELEIFSSKHKYTNKDLTDLSQMRDLKRLLLYTTDGKYHSTDDSAVIQLFDNCKEFKELELSFRSNITVKTIDKLKEVANNRHKQTIKFSTKIWSIKSPELRRSLTEMPNNLFIYLK